MELKESKIQTEQSLNGCQVKLVSIEEWTKRNNKQEKN